jgi:hypothetical protein
MDKRRSKRIGESLDAEIIAGDIRYNGIILNFSEDGLYMVTATTYSVVDITPSTMLKLKCKLPAGHFLDMNCEVKWFKTKPSPFGITFSMGMEILDPPFEYKEYLKSIAD